MTSTLLLERLQAKNNGEPMQGDSLVDHLKRLAARWSEQDDAPQPKPKRRRKPSVTRYFRDARKGGEKGVVRVSITDPNGFTVTVASGDQDQQSDAPAANPWDEVSKHATH